MAYTKYSLTPANNNATPPDGAPEGMLPSAVNDTMRDMMAQIRDVGDGIRGGTYTMTAPVITGGTITGVTFTGNTFTSPVISGGSINNTTIGGTTAAAGTFTSLSDSGNLTFTGTGNRITGDFSNATFANRVYVQTSTSGGNTAFGLLPHPSNATPITTFEACLSSDPANTNTTQLQVTTTDSRINAGLRGTASALPLTMYTGGSERLRIDTSGNVGIGTSSPTQKLQVESSSDVTIQLTKTGVASFTLTNNGTSGTVLNVESVPMIFNTSNTERMRITSGGNVGIGTTSPSYQLHVVNGGGNSESVLAQYGSGTRALIGAYSNEVAIKAFNGTNDVMSFYTGASERMRITSGGDLLVGTTTSNGRFSSISKSGFNPASTAGTWQSSGAIAVSGSFGGGVSWIDGSGGYCAWVDDNGTDFNIAGGTTANVVANGVFLNGHAATSWSARSDERLKDKLEPITNAVEKVNSLRALTGVYKNFPDVKQAFLIAQDVQKVLPEAVSIADKKSPEQYLGLAYTQVIPLLVAAIQELNAKVEAQAAEIALLKSK